jgi:hypothetical protein
VTADDFSWNSPTSSSFVFQRTFNSVEEILYHCTVHSSPGRDISTNQNGRINVVDEGSMFLINPAISDAWFDPLTGGQGFFIIVWEDIQTIFLSWFTYTSGGVFDSPEPPVDTPVNVGMITIVWSGCNAGLLTYDLTTPLVSGQIPIERIVLDNVPACEAGQAAAR